jgi:hypothetical protein
LVLGGNALGHIPIGERIEHLDEIIQRLGGVIAQRVERGTNIEHQPGFAVKIDTLGEVASDRRLNDAANRRLELARHFLHCHFAFGGGFFVLLGLFSGFELGSFGGFYLEGLDRSRDIADFVLAAKAEQNDIKISVRELAHACRQRADRIRDAVLGLGAVFSDDTLARGASCTLATLPIRKKAMRSSIALA